MTHLSRAPGAGDRARPHSLAPSARGEVRHFKIPGLSKLRIGGSIGKAFEDVKKVKVLGVPLAAMGNPLTDLELQSQQNGGDLGKAVKGVGQDLVAGAKNVPLAMGIAKALPGDTTGAPGDPSAAAGGAQSSVDRIKSMLQQGGPEALALAKTLMGSIGGVDGLLGIGAGAASVADKLKQGGLQDKAVKYATDPYDAKAPLRTRALSLLSSDAPTPDLSSIFSNSGNVYDRQKRGLPPLTSTPSAASQLTGGNALTNAIGARAGAPDSGAVPVAAPVAAPAPGGIAPGAVPAMPLAAAPTTSRFPVPQ